MGIKISVISPTYNRAAYVVETVKSVLNQSLKEIELIIVDDGSSDNTKEVLQEYIIQGKINYQWQQNSGRSEARNHGAKIATGIFLLFLDSDDLLHPKALENLYELSLLHPRSSVIAGKSGLFTTTKEPWYNHSLNYSASVADESDNADYFLNIGAYMIRREVFFKTGGFNKNFEPAEDVDFSIKTLHDNLLTWSNSFVVVDKRRHDENTDDTKLHTASYKIFTYYIQQIKAKKFPKFTAEKRRMLSKFYACLLYECYFLNRKSKGILFFSKMTANDITKIVSVKRWKLLLLLLLKKKNK